MAKREQLKPGFKQCFETRFNPPFEKANHLRAHRPGRPSKIDTDPELHAFVVARIDTTTFTELARQIADAFPADRRVGKSALHHWWQKQPNRHG